MSSRVTLATLYGIGLCGFAPGTAGSAVAALLTFFIVQLPFGWVLLAVGAALFSWLGVKSATRYMRDNACKHDPREIIVDELAGQWLTFSVFHVLALAHTSGQSVDLTVLLCVAGFLLFRVFDILKPWPICWFDRHVHGGWGVMLDDLVAAVPAGVVLYTVFVMAVFE